MTEELELELVHGSGNVFRDLDDPDADLKQAKAILAARIIAALDGTGLTVRKASELTGFAAADFSRIRNANLTRFTLDRLMRMLAAVDRSAGVTVHIGNRLPHRPSSNAASPEGYSTPARRSVVVDKSYAQGVRSLSELHRDWDLVFPDAFFFEVASTDFEARDRCMKKLRQLHDEGGVRIAPNVGEMLHKEIQGLHSAGVPSDNLIRGMDLDGFFGMTFEDLSTARRDALLQTETDFSRDIDALAVKTNMLLGRFGGTSEGTTEEREAAYRSARSTIAHDRDFVCGFFADFVCRGSHAPPAAPLLAAIARSDAFGPAWTIYRWVQTQLLYGLELAEKHGQLDLEALGPRHRERLQHDAIDMEYLVLAVLQGALASKDKRMRRLFVLLCPEGTVLPAPGDS